MTTHIVTLACGHTVPFSDKSIKLNGYPSRWWCNHCRISSDVVK